MSYPALFLDRDGVINIDHAYVYQSENFNFIDGIFELCQAVQSLGYKIFVITNQAGIGRGYYTELEFDKLTQWMLDIFKQHNVIIEKVYFCPHHPEHGIGQYKQDSYFRKPNPGMILQAVAEFDIDLQHSVLIGDKLTDIYAGKSAGIQTNLLYSPKHLNENILDNNLVVIHELIDALPFFKPYKLGH